MDEARFGREIAVLYFHAQCHLISLRQARMLFSFYLFVAGFNAGLILAAAYARSLEWLNIVHAATFIVMVMALEAVWHHADPYHYWKTKVRFSQLVHKHAKWHKATDL